MEFENELDDIWMKDFEKTDKSYEEFYNEDIFYIGIHFVYINSSNSIEKITYEHFLMSQPNYMCRDEILGLIKRNYIVNNIKYILLSILKYNINLNPSDIKQFLKINDTDVYNDKFFTNIKNIDTIKFDKTINMFQDLNDIFIIFYEKPDSNISDNLNIDLHKNSNTNNVTKRIFMNSNNKHKKTIRKQ
jgi:hypothetical protein